MEKTEGTICTIADLLEIVEILGKNRVGTNQKIIFIMDEEKSFEEWYDAFCEFVRGGGYTGRIDQGTFEEEYEAGKDAYHVAQEFLVEMMED